MSLNDIISRNLKFITKYNGSVVNYNGNTAYGYLFNEPTEALQMNSKQIAVNDTTLTLIIPSDSIGIISNNTKIEVDNIYYMINKYIVLSDGLETKLFLYGV